MKSNSVLSTDRVTKTLAGEIPVTLVKDVSLDVTRGEFVVINGPSGSGKSSLLYLLGLLDAPTGGKVWLKGKDTSKYSDDELATLRLAEIGFVFQFHFLLPEFSALENVMLPMQRLGSLSSNKIKERAAALLSRLGLNESLHKRPRQLSGGQSQRVAIARALANDPTIILADEPTGNLDSTSSANVQSILRGLASQEQRAVITVTHDTDFAKLADRVITIVDGKISNFAS